MREFVAGPELWEILDSWAQRNGYRLRGQDQNSRLYQRGSGLMVAPQRLQVTYLGDRYRLEAWVWNPPINRLLTLMLLPEDLPLESGGFLGTLPRRKAREQVNQLLQELGQPPIP